MKKIFLFIFGSLGLLILSSCSFFYNLVIKNPPSWTFSEIVSKINQDLDISFESAIQPETSKFYYNSFYEQEPKKIVSFQYSDQSGSISQTYQQNLLGSYFTNYADWLYDPQETYAVYIDLAYGVVYIRDEKNLDYLKVDNSNLNSFHLQQFGFTGLPNVGKYDVLVVPIDFSNVRYNEIQLDDLNLVFNGSSAQTGWESVASYYYKSSSGQLDLTFDFAEVYHSANPTYHYQMMGQRGANQVINEYLGSSPNVDFSAYDHNDDNYVDSIIFVYSNAQNYDIKPWWAWCEVLKDTKINNNLNVGFIQWISYNFINLKYGGFHPNVNAETYIHETGHLLGLLDYYTNNNTEPTGGLDMMARNIGDHTAVSKMLLNWISPKDYGMGVSVNLRDYALSGDFLIIPYNNDFKVFGEYYILLNYQPTGLYEGAKNSHFGYNGQGVMLYHIDARLAFNPYNQFRIFLNNNVDGFKKKFIELVDFSAYNTINLGISYDVLLQPGSWQINLPWNTLGDNNQPSNTQISLNLSPFNGDQSLNVTIAYI
ncbi:MAG: hypothetical protein LBV55_00575 [Acholeplasmatales bacterium]|jgi:M6 family metalloprotease-like protein|nr:hypothetical protein [Acholeplasmatales bacterium]